MAKKKPKNPLIPSYRPRHDGWTEARTKTFLATLRQTGCVKDAARVIGMSTNSGYRLRKKDAAFRAAWDTALLDARRGLIAVAHERAVVGRETVIIRKGEEVERRIQPSDAMLALLLKQGDMGGEGGRVGNRTADKILTVDEWQEGMRFDPDGRKCDGAQADAALRARVRAKLAMMQSKIQAREDGLYEAGQRVINITTGEGFTPEVVAAVGHFGESSTVPLIEDHSEG